MQTIIVMITIVPYNIASEKSASWWELMERTNINSRKQIVF